MNNKFIGTGVALVTPFKLDLSVDHDALTNIVNFNIDNGTDYLVICGTTGESVTITKQEKKEIIATISKANNNRVPMVLGIGGNNTAEVVAEIKATDLTNLDAILSVSPYYSKPTQEGVYQHFKSIAENCDKPIIVYNVPSRTGTNIVPSTILRLANDFENIVAVKEAAGDIVQAMRLIHLKPEGFHIISGDDMIALPMVHAGGSGVISVIGQGLPKGFSEMITLGLAGEVSKANALHYRLMDSINFIFEEGNPCGIKALLSKLSICSNNVRLPLVNASYELQQKLNTFVENYKQ